MRRAATMLILILAASTAKAQNVTVQIAKAWESRQSRVKSAEFRVTATGFYSKGGISHQLSAKEQQRLGVLPATDTQTTWSEVIILDGPRIRVEAKGTLWAGDAFRYRELTAVLDGAIRRTLELGDKMNPAGLVNKESDYFEAKGQNVKPISRCFRGMAPGFKSFFVDDLKMTNAKTVIGGRTCEQFILRREGGDRNEYWLDPEREWVLVREVYVNPSRERTQLDIQYQPHQQAGWLPKTWEFRRTLDERAPVSVEKYTVESYEINPSLPESAFDLPFPVGTTVADFTNGRKDYVVEEGGSQRILLDQTSTRSRQWWLYGAVGLAVCSVVGGWLVWRRRRGSAQVGNVIP